MFTSLSRSPEQSRRYLKNFDREEITKNLCSDILNAIQVLTSRQNLSPKELQERVIQVQRVLEAVQKKSVGAENFSKLQSFLKECYAVLFPTEKNASLDTISKYVKAIYQMRKALSENSEASEDYRDYLKHKKEEKSTKSFAPVKKLPPIVPATQKIVQGPSKLNLRPEIAADRPKPSNLAVTIKPSPSTNLIPHSIDSTKSPQKPILPNSLLAPKSETAKIAPAGPSRQPLTTQQSILVQELLAKMAQHQHPK